MNNYKFLRISLGVIAVGMAGFVLKVGYPVLVPFFLAVFMSYLLDPPVDFLLKRKIPRWLAIFLVVFIAVIVLFSAGLIIYNLLRDFAVVLSTKYENRLVDLSQSLISKLSDVFPDVKHSFAAVKIDLAKVAAWLIRSLGTFLGFVWKLFLVIMFLAFIIFSRGQATAKLAAALGKQRSEMITGVINEINIQVRKYLVIKTIMSLINGLMVWAVLKMFKVDFAEIFGFIAFALNYIPNLGSLVATILRVSFALLQFGTIWIPLWILIITVSLDALMGNIIEPKIMGSGLGLSPLVIIFSLMFWGWMWGISGLILAVPIAAVVRIACQNIPGLKVVAVMMADSTGGDPSVIRAR